MATFKVGQRVRVVGGVQSHWIGCEVEILGLPGTVSIFPNEYRISRPAADTDPYAFSFSAPPHHLSPLTDPKADEFIERIKKIAREPVNAPKVTA